MQESEISLVLQPATEYLTITNTKGPIHCGFAWSGTNVLNQGGSCRELEAFKLISKLTRHADPDPWSGQPRIAEIESALLLGGQFSWLPCGLGWGFLRFLGFGGCILDLFDAGLRKYRGF